MVSLNTFLSTILFCLLSVNFKIANCTFVNSSLASALSDSSDTEVLSPLDSNNTRNQSFPVLNSTNEFVFENLSKIDTIALNETVKKSPFLFGMLGGLVGSMFYSSSHNHHHYYQNTDDSPSYTPPKDYYKSCLAYNNTFYCDYNQNIGRGNRMNAKDCVSYKNTTYCNVYVTPSSTDGPYREILTWASDASIVKGSVLSSMVVIGLVHGLLL